MTLPRGHLIAGWPSTKSSPPPRRHTAIHAVALGQPASAPEWNRNGLPPSRISERHAVGWQRRRRHAQHLEHVTAARQRINPDLADDALEARRRLHIERELQIRQGYAIELGRVDLGEAVEHRHCERVGDRLLSSDLQATFLDVPAAR